MGFGTLDVTCTSSRNRWCQFFRVSDKLWNLDQLLEESKVKLLDKGAFAFGVCLVAYSEYVVIRHPAWFSEFYFWLMFGLLSYRYVSYRRKKWHFFLIDFCYAVNASCMVQVRWFPLWERWFAANYFASLGPIAASVVVWQNSIVFHSVTRLSTFLMHICPAVACHLHRRYVFPAHLEPEKTAILNLLMPYFVMYMSWQIFYLAFTEYLYKDYLNSDPELSTSLRYVCRDRRQILNKIATKTLQMVGVFRPDEHFNESTSSSLGLFVLAQAIYTTLTILPPILTWYACHEVFGTAWLVFLFAVGAWNGGSYYVEIFSKRYNLKFPSSELSGNKCADCLRVNSNS